MTFVQTTPGPVVKGVYIGLVSDVPGTTAQNVFLALFNPPGGNIVSALQLTVSAYTIGSSSTPSSFLVSRITGYSGGTLVAPATVPRFVTTMPNPVTQVVTGNPSVTLSGTPVYNLSPPISTGAGTSGVGSISAAAAALVLPGQGLAFYTAAGNTNQLWDVNVAFEEF